MNALARSAIESVAFILTLFLIVAMIAGGLYLASMGLNVHNVLQVVLGFFLCALGAAIGFALADVL